MGKHKNFLTNFNYQLNSNFRRGQPRHGFTMIEVILVLAIAGLIFAMVFTALPGLWAASRDSERRDDVLTFIDTLKNFQTNNNRGALPTFNGTDQAIAFRVDGSAIRNDTTVTAKDVTWKGFYKNYLPEGWVDPEGPNYNLVVTYCNTNTLDATCPGGNLDGTSAISKLDQSFSENDYNIYVVIGAVCYGTEAKKSANERNVAVLIKLEAADRYCANT